MEVKTVTQKEFLDWINSKNPEDVFLMRSNMSFDECGCLMVQYANDTAGFIPTNMGTPNWGCGYGEWEADLYFKEDPDDCETTPFATFENEMNIWDIVLDVLDGTDWSEPMTYGELQRRLKEKSNH